jgi:hypothetical protein
MLPWIVGGLVIALFTALVLRCGRFYLRVFSIDHVREVRERLAQAKRSALAEVGHPASSPAEDLAAGRAFVTSPGLAFMYTVDAVNEAGAKKYEHHISISNRGSFLATAAASYVAAVVYKLLMPESPVGFALSRTGVYHLMFRLSAEDHASYATRPVVEVDEAGAKALAAVCIEERRTLLDGLKRQR